MKSLCEYFLDYFKHLPLVVQVALVLSGLLLLLVIGYNPVVGSTIIGFLAALKVLGSSNRKNRRKR